MNDLMIDLETLGRSPGAIFHEIAAVPFDITSGHTHPGFHEIIDITSAGRAGLHTDPETLAWWNDQGGPRQENAGMFFQVIPAFHEFLTELNPARVWAWRSEFDIPILNAGLRASFLEPPQKYTSRCALTVWDTAFPGIIHDRVPGHHALDDCRNQISQLREALTVLNSPLLASK